MRQHKLSNVLFSVYCEPWLIRPQVHAQIRDIVQKHISGAAHLEGIMDKYMPEDKEDQAMYEVEDGCACIEICGVIGKRVSDIEKCSGMCDVNDITKELDACMADDNVQSIMLDIASPGGTVTGIQELAEKIAECRMTKPVMAYTDAQMCSAAYWIGSAASVIAASPSATVGSIGVYMALLDSSAMQAAAGLKTEVFKAGKFKGAGIPGTTLTDEQRSQMQAQVDYIMQQFTSSVRENRGVHISDDVMQGQTHFAKQAVGMGLVDMVGTRAEAKSAIGKLKNKRG